MSNDEKKSRFFALLSQLSDEDRAKLVEEFGFDLTTDESLKQVAMELDKTRERIRKIEAVALKKLRDRGSDPDDAA